jgi:hypothetical protein
MSFFYLQQQFTLSSMYIYTSICIWE